MKSTTKNLYPFRQIAIRTRCLHRLTPHELMVRKGFWLLLEKREGSFSRLQLSSKKILSYFPPFSPFSGFCC